MNFDNICITLPSNYFQRDYNIFDKQIVLKRMKKVISIDRLLDN
jgi:hypothetical protein